MNTIEAGRFYDAWYERVVLPLEAIIQGKEALANSGRVEHFGLGRDADDLAEQVRAMNQTLVDPAADMLVQAMSDIERHEALRVATRLALRDEAAQSRIDAQRRAHMDNEDLKAERRAGRRRYFETLTAEFETDFPE